MEYSIDQAKTIFSLIHDATWYAIPLILSLVFPVLWLFLKKLMGQNTSAPASDSVIDKVASAISLQGDTADRIVFIASLILFVGGVILLKWGENNEEAIRRKALGLKQYYNLNQDVMGIPKNLIPSYFKDDLDAILKDYPQDFIMTVAVKGSKKIETTGSTVIETVYCVDSNYIKNYKSNVNSYLNEYIDKRLLTEPAVAINSLFKDNYLQNFFVNRFVYNFLAQPTSVSKYFLETVNTEVYISARLSQPLDGASQTTVISKNACQTAVEIILNELKKNNWERIGFNRLKENTHHPEYANDFLRKTLDFSKGKLKLIKLNDDGTHDTLGILLVK